MTEVTETLLSQKLERSSWRAYDATDNFKEEKELTVEITLAEYRELISRNAKSNYELEKKESEIRELTNTLKELTCKSERLESFVESLKCKCVDNSEFVEREVE